MLDAFCDNARRFGQHSQMFQSLRDADNVFLIVHKEFGQVTVSQINPSFVVGFLTGYVVSTNFVEQRSTRTAHRATYIIARLYLANVFTNFDDLAEGLVSQDKKIRSRRRRAVKSVVDFPIGGIHTNL